jgi:hypothetical protein
MENFCVLSRGILFARWKEQAVPATTMLTMLIGGPSHCGARRGVSTVGKQQRCLLFYMLAGWLGEAIYNIQHNVNVNLHFEFN